MNIFTFQGMEQSYRSCGWRVKIYTETAVSDHYGVTEFYSDNDFKHNEWGGSILGPNIMKPIQKANRDKTTKQNGLNFKYTKSEGKNVGKNVVNLIKLSDFINNVVATRKIYPLSSSEKSEENMKPPTVMMKLDIEGSEVDVVSDLLFSGSLKHLDVTMIEWHHDLMNHSIFRTKTIWVSDIINTFLFFRLFNKLCTINQQILLRG